MSERNNTRVLKALGSAVRQDILDALAAGPATSAMLARRLGSNTGVMSYQVRRLADAGLVEIDRESGRARYWRLSGGGYDFDDPQASEHPELAQAAIDHRLARFTTSVNRYLHRTDLSEKWRDASLFSESALYLAPDELAEFSADYLALLERWHRRIDGRTPHRRRARPVRLALFAYPDDIPEKGGHHDNVDRPSR